MCVSLLCGPFNLIPKLYLFSSFLFTFKTNDLLPTPGYTSLRRRLHVGSNASLLGFGTLGGMRMTKSAFAAFNFNILIVASVCEQCMSVERRVGTQFRLDKLHCRGKLENCIRKQVNAWVKEHSALECRLVFGTYQFSCNFCGFCPRPLLINRTNSGWANMHNDVCLPPYSKCKKMTDRSSGICSWPGT